MTRNDDFIATLEDYLNVFDGATPLPERVSDAVHAALPRTRQVHARPGPLRIFPMFPNVTARSGLAAAALVVAVVGLGAVVLSNNRNEAVGGPAPIASPTPTPAASASPLVLLHNAPLETCPETTGECFVPGRYAFGAGWPGEMSIAVPEGWFDYGPGGGSTSFLVDRSPALDGSGWGILMSKVGTVSRDPCDPGAGTYSAPLVDTPGQLAAAMADWPGFEVTSPETITIAGRAGVQVEISSTLKTADCPTSVLWTTPNGTSMDAYPMISNLDLEGGYPSKYDIVDVDGTLIAIMTPSLTQTSPFEEGQGIARDPDRHAADAVEMQAILDSIEMSSP